jgi:hypothetical protein
LANLANTTLGGVNVQNVRSISDLNLSQAARITQAYASGSFPLNLIVNMEVKNPNATTAAMNSVDWIMLIDDKEIVDGAVNERIQIAPDGGITNLPIRISTDLRKVLSGYACRSGSKYGIRFIGQWWQTYQGYPKNKTLYYGRPDRTTVPRLY